MFVLAAVFAVSLADAGSVRIATTVTDRQGRPVAGLTARDFEITEDGVVQRIDAVEPRRPEPRRLAILLDEFHVAPADSGRVREALTRFVDDRLRAGDSAVVLKPLEPLSSIRLTSDRDALRRAIAGFEGRKGIFAPRTPLEEETLGRAPALVEAGRAQVVLSALRALTAQLGALPGRAAILIVSEGFEQQARASTSRGLPDAGVVERFANRYDVPIYAFDPRTPGAETDAGVLLPRLVTVTGGTLSRGPDLQSSVERAASELDGGYTVIYTSAHSDDGRYHPVQVSIARGLAAARARAGYVSGPSPEMRRAMRGAGDAPDAPPRLLHQSTLVQIWSGVTRLTRDDAQVAVSWQPGPGAGGGLSPAARVVLKATTPAGRVLYEGPIGAVGTAGAEGTSAEFSAPSGRVQLEMTVLGIAGQHLDTDTRDLDVPALGAPGSVLLPPVLIATQSAREFRGAAADAGGAPAPARQFRRTQRLIVRVPAYSAGAPARVTARLLNRVGQPIRDLDVLPGDAGGVPQFDLPLAPLAPGDYFLQFSIQGGAGAVAQRVGFKVTG